MHSSKNNNSNNNLQNKSYSIQIMPATLSYYLSTILCSFTFFFGRTDMGQIIERFQSRGQHLCKFNGPKESVYTGKELLLWNTNMAAVSLFCKTNMAAAVTSFKTLYTYIIAETLAKKGKTPSMGKLV